MLDKLLKKFNHQPVTYKDNPLTNTSLHLTTIHKKLKPNWKEYLTRIIIRTINKYTLSQRVQSKQLQTLFNQLLRQLM